MMVSNKANFFILKLLIGAFFISFFSINAQQKDLVSVQSNEQLLRPIKYKPFFKTYSNELEEVLRKELSKNGRWKKLIDAKKMCVGIVDLKDINNVKFASINGNTMLYAASLPKLAILLATEDALDKGFLRDTKSIHKDMRLMISKSNNQAATRLMDLVGPERLESVVRDPKYGFYSEESGGGLWVGKRYASGGKVYREPLKNLSHAATADQVCNYYYMLIHGKLVSEERSKHMLSMLVAPKLTHKFVNSLIKIHPDAKLYRKSGTWQNWHADSVLVMSATSKYILVGLIQDSHGEQIMRDIVKPIDNILK